MENIIIKIRDQWYKKGYNAGLRKNKSECCCIIDDKKGVVSVCGEHEQWRDKELESLRECWNKLRCNKNSELYSTASANFYVLCDIINKLAKKLGWNK